MQIPISTDEDKLLEAMGLNPAVLSPEQKQDSLRDILKVLNWQVGERVIDSLNEEKMIELDKLMSGEDEKALTDWLAANVPDYNQIIEEELKKMKADFDRVTEKVRQR